MTPTIINTTTTKHRRLNSSRRWAGLWFILPCMVFVTVFFLAPLVMTLWMSLHDWPLLGKSSFIGFENYVSLASDTTFWNSLWFTTKYTLVVTPVIFLLAFGLALLVQSRRRMVGWFRTAFFLPVVIGLGAASLLWVWLFNDQVGVFSAILMLLGLTKAPLQWLGDPNTALVSIVAMVVWKVTGFTMLLLLVGRQSPRSFTKPPGLTVRIGVHRSGLSPYPCCAVPSRWH